MKQYITKNTKAEVKDIDTVTGVVSGYFSAFDNVDSDGDMIVKGAYSKTLAENGPTSTNPRIFHLAHHDWQKPLAKPKTLIEDDHGLYFETQISKTSWGKDYLQLYVDGVITEHSVGINLLQTEKIDDKSQRVLEVKMWEGSSVTWGANENTPTTGIKALDTREPEDLIQRMDLLSKTLRRGNMRDDTYELIQIEYEQIKTIIQALILKREEPPAGTPNGKDEPLDSEQLNKLFTDFKNRFI